MVECINTGLPMVEMWGWNPFRFAVVVFASDPAVFGERMVATTPERQVVDVGVGALGVRRDVMDLAPIAGHVTPGMRTPTVLGV